MDARGTETDTSTADPETPRPDPDDPRKPESPTEISKPSWRYILKMSAREFSRDQCTDLAAALTYYAVLSLFPAMLAVIALLGVFGQGQATVDAVMSMVDQLGPSSAVDTLREPIERLVNAPAAGFALVTGVVGALWSASGYVGAFGRAMNRIYEIEEGRPFWKLRPAMLLVTLIGLVLVAAASVMLAISGPVATAIGNVVGLGDTTLMIWNIAKWPVVLVAVVLAVAILYYVTPNVKQPKFRWVSGGAAVAILVWIVASVAFGLYVGNFGNYDKTYGSLAGAVVFLLWLWITNLALLFGAELDSELERGRQLQAGMRAEEELQLPPKDTRVTEKNAEADAKAIEEGRQLRESHTPDRPSALTKGTVRASATPDDPEKLDPKKTAASVAAGVALALALTRWSGRRRQTQQASQ